MLKIFPRTIYKIDDFDYLKVTDLTFYFKIKEFVKTFGFENGRDYIVKNGESPSSVSYKEYATTRFESSILILNNIVSVYDEWPRSDSSFLQYIEAKYGSVNYAKENVANYYRDDGLKVTRETWFTLAQTDKYFETLYDYEIKENDKKARIKLVDYNMMLNFEVELRRYVMSTITKENTRISR